MNCTNVYYVFLCTIKFLHTQTHTLIRILAVVIVVDVFVMFFFLNECYYQQLSFIHIHFFHQIRFSNANVIYCIFPRLSFTTFLFLLAFYLFALVSSLSSSSSSWLLFEKKVADIIYIIINLILICILTLEIKLYTIIHDDYDK